MAPTNFINAVETDRPLYESFDNGIGVFTDNWNVDATVPGQVTLRGTSGLMQQTGSTASGQGYGTYTINAKMEGTQPGPAIILWPGDNRWPGQEINLAEVTNDGTGRIYGALHWDDNGDHAVTDIYDNVLTGVFHEFKLIWEPNLLTYLVDGVKQAEFTQYVPLDYDHGGMNNVIGWLNTNFATSMTVTDVDYVPLGVAGTPVAEAPVLVPSPVPVSPTPASPTPASPTPASPVATSPIPVDPTPVQPAPFTPVAPVSVTSAPVDWNALAAQAAANFAATGHWYYDMPGSGDTTTTSVPSVPAETPIDWDALAAQAAANYAATGQWFY